MNTQHRSCYFCNRLLSSTDEVLRGDVCDACCAALRSGAAAAPREIPPCLQAFAASFAPRLAPTPLPSDGRWTPEEAMAFNARRRREKAALAIDASPIRLRRLYA